MARTRPGVGVATAVGITALCIIPGPRYVQAQSGVTECGREGGADIIVGEVASVANWQRVGDIDAFSWGVTFCNLGDEAGVFMANDDQHPVHAQNMYRLLDGRFEQIGLSWLPHAFFALSQNQCGCGCTAMGGSTLGEGCSSPESASISGYQPNMGPRSEVNAHTGAFAFPFSYRGESGDFIYKRVQVHAADLDVAQNQGARYFAEDQVVSPDDALNGFQNNNASHRELVVARTGSEWQAALTGSTTREQPAIRAWAALDPTVMAADVQVPDDGLFVVAGKATYAGAGVWQYEYAIQNLNSHRCGGSFSVPIPNGAVVEGIGFHDVDYHSGEPFDLTDWAGVTDGGALRWTTGPFETDPNANALRWGTLYNFRFTANREPMQGEVTIGLFRPGSPASVVAQSLVPAWRFGDLDGDLDIDWVDYAGWPGCVTGPGSAHSGSPCAVFDHEPDGDVDMTDYAAFMYAFLEE